MSIYSIHLIDGHFIVPGKVQDVGSTFRNTIAVVLAIVDGVALVKLAD